MFLALNKQRKRFKSSLVLLFKGFVTFVFMLVTYKGFSINVKLRSELSQNANDLGWFVIIKTKLTTKEKKECKRREDYIHIIRG
jgi:hypothetical protein